MFITIKNEVLEEISNLRKAKKSYDAAGDLKKGRFTDNLISERCRDAMMGIISGIDKANKRGDDYAQEQVDTARTLGDGE